MFNSKLVKKFLKIIPFSLTNDNLNDYFIGFRKELLEMVKQQDWLKNLKSKVEKDLLGCKDEETLTFLKKINLLIENSMDEEFFEEDEFIYKSNLKQNEVFSRNIVYGDFVLNELDKLSHENEEKTTVRLKEIANQLINLYGLKDVLYSSELSQKNVLYFLLLSRLHLDYLFNVFENKISLNGKVLCFDLNNFSQIDNDYVYIASGENDPFAQALFHLVLNKINEKEFILDFYKNKASSLNKDEKLNLMSNYLFLLKNNKDLIKDNKIEEVLALLNETINVYLDQREEINFNKAKSENFYLNWRDGFGKFLNDFNVQIIFEKKPLLKREIFLLSVLFKFIIEDRHHLSFWVSNTLIEKLSFYLFKFHKDIKNYDEYEKLIVEIFENEKSLNVFVNNFKDDINYTLLYHSYLSYVNYFREDKGLLDILIVPQTFIDLEREMVNWSKAISKMN